MKPRDLKDLRFGRLVAQTPITPRNGPSKWVCQCDCGSIVNVYATALIQGLTKSCGCLKREILSARGVRRAKDLKGQRFGRWLVLGRDYEEALRHKTKSAFWKCHCDCGVERSNASSWLLSGRSSSCGCFSREESSRRGKFYRALPVGVSASNELFYRYKVQARKRSLPFDLTRDQFDTLVKAPCAYCGDPPGNIIQAKYGRNGGLRYSGVDRINNTKGYEVGNVVPCCVACNRAKMDRTVEEFRSWVLRVAAKMESSGGPIA